MTFTRRLLASPLLLPLQARDFRLLVAAAIVSLLGDGFFYVALAWQVYAISNVPIALSLVGLAWTLPQVLFLLLGGVFSDRFDRRRLMIGADLVRALAIGLMGALSVLGWIELWHLTVLIALVGVGDAFFNPASTAIVPDLVAEDRLPAANALSGMYRPLMFRLLGPAIAGFVVAYAGPGPAFVIDALSFVASAVVVAGIHARPVRPAGGGIGVRRTLTEVGEGLRFVRASPWCWATLVAAMLSLLAFQGPVAVLVPFLVKNRLGLGPDSLGAILAAGGIGSILMAIVVGQVGLPRLRITVMYAAFTGGGALMAVFGVMTDLWQPLLAMSAAQAAFQLGQVIWVTLLQQLVPRELLGRVASLDWLMTIGLVPVSYALTGPVSELFGPERTMVAGALIGAVLMGALLFVPGVRDPERRPATAGAEQAA